MVIVNKIPWFSIAGINGLFAVIMGAIAAHAIDHAQAAAMAEKASLYQLIHAVVLVAIAHQSSKFFCMARWMFLIGIILFSGSLYVRALTDWEAITRVAPAGGISLMIGWLLIIGTGYSQK